ncbi:MAG TPA: hypothetical protein VKZ72_07865 [Acidimicrobiales bacterium]|nr:hypothetical protein [Acidimicrobiales bacterium]
MTTTTQDSSSHVDDTPVHAEDVTVSVTVRVTACRPEEDGIFSVAQLGGERILGYIRQRDDGWYWAARPTGGYPPVWTGPFGVSDAAIVGLLTRSAVAAG